MILSNKYRIITNDRKYRIQRRRFGIFWVTIKTHIGYDMYEYTEFDCINNAKAYIINLRAEELRLYYSKRKWKVLK